MEQVIARYDVGHAALVDPLGNAGGFSGCCLWKVRSVVGEFCLRRWPRPHPSLEHLSWIHEVLQHVYAEGCFFVPVPIKSNDGSTLVEFGEHYWELTDWVPGTANFFDDPCDARLQSAIECLAKFHQSSSRFSRRSSPSENLAIVIRNLERVGEAIELAEEQIDTTTSTELINLFSILKRQSLSHSKMLLQQLRPFGNKELQQHPVIRDIWHDHIFFVDDKVSGFVDFGALRTDSPCFDLARMLGSLVGDNPLRMAQAIDFYQALRPLQDFEQELIPLLDRCGVLIGCFNWIRWLVVERREFESLPAVAKRVQLLTNRYVDLFG